MAPGCLLAQSLLLFSHLTVESPPLLLQGPLLLLQVLLKPTDSEDAHALAGGHGASWGPLSSMGPHKAEKRPQLS